MMMGIKESTVGPLFCYFNTNKEWSSFAHNNIILHSTENVLVIWNDFKSNHKISNQIQIKSRAF